MAINDLNARTTNMTARITAFSHYRPSPVALEARALRRVNRMENVNERRAAFAQLMSDYPPVIGNY